MNSLIIMLMALPFFVLSSEEVDLNTSLDYKYGDSFARGTMSFGSFVDTCDKYAVKTRRANRSEMEFWVLEAEECTIVDRREKSSIMLGQCIGNANGRLQWQFRGHFDESCKDCEFDVSKSTIITCTCNGEGKKKNWHKTSIDIAEKIGWDSDKLRCFPPDYDPDKE